MTYPRQIEDLDVRGTFTAPNQTVGSATAVSPILAIQGLEANQRGIVFQDEAAEAHIGIYVSGSVTGSGNAGDDLIIKAFTDNGTLIDTIVTLVRASGGTVTFARPLSNGANALTTGAITSSGAMTVNATPNKFGADATASTIINNNGTAASNCGYRWSSASTAKWTLYREGTTHNLILYNEALGATALTFASANSAATFVGALTANSLTLTTDLSVANGGTGASTLTQYGVVVGNGTGAVAVTAAGTAGYVLTGNGSANPTFQIPKWSTWISPLNMLTSANGTSTLLVLNAGHVAMPQHTLANAATSTIHGAVAMPDGYAGQALTVEIYWSTAAAGTTGDVYFWVKLASFKDDDAGAATVTTVNATDTFTAQKDINMVSASITPTNADASDKLLSLTIGRLGSDVLDTFDADAYLIGVRISW